jgi:DNA-binding MarR family transcriptional regulator
MDSDAISLFLFNIIIPFSFSLIITLTITKFYNKIKYNLNSRHVLELKVFQIEKQLKEQIEKNNFLEEQIDIVLSRTNQINTISSSISILINLMNQTIINKSLSQYNIASTGQNHVSNPNINQSQGQIDHHKILSQSEQESSDNNHSNSTIEYILKKLEDNSLTTREIQKQIGRTREHTSRLLKKLYDNKIVERDMASKPFKYTITDEGRKLLTKYYASKNSHRSGVPRNIESLQDGLTTT